MGLCMALTVAFIRRDDVPLDKLVNSLQRWTDSIPQEKIYLHMDKPYYALGDTVWFKGYLTVGPKHQLSALSGAMYVELLSEKDSLLQQLKLPVTSGMVMGNFILNDDYQQGNYRIRAYTRWMRNAGDDYFFDHTFMVGDVAGGEIIAKANFSFQKNKGKPILTAQLNYSNENKQALAGKSLRYEIRINNKALWQQNSRTDAQGNLQILIPDEIKQHPEGAYIHTILQGNDKYPTIHDFPIKISSTQSDIQFFAESGNLVNGIASRVAFKATGTDGLGLNIKGTIVDGDNNQITKLETLHAGMGSFLITPMAGKTYTANIVFDGGATKSIALPKALDQGYVFSVDQTKDSVRLRINTSTTLLPSHINLVAHTGGEVIFSSGINIRTPVTSVWLEKKAFRTGIAQFTLFNTAGEPLNERVAFIRNHDQLSLDIKTAKADYNSKEKVEIELAARDSKDRGTAGNFSVAVIDESKLPFDEANESTIFSNLLLTADLKGYIEQPNYYFTKSGEQVDKALDNLMLTQGYRRFTWKQLDTLAEGKPQYPAEKLGTVISGRVMTLGVKPKPVANANVSMVALRAGLLKSAKANADGYFSFEPIFITDSIKFTIQARTAKGSDKVKLQLDTIAGATVNHNPNQANANLNIHSTIKQYLDAGKKQDDVYEKLGLPNKVHRIKEVKIRAQKKPQMSSTQIAMQGILQVPEESVDKVYKIPQPELCANLGLCLQGVLPRVEFVPREVSRGLYQRFFPLFPMYRDAGQLTSINIVVDGVKVADDIEKGELFNDGTLDATDVVKIEVVHANMALKAILGGPTVLIFTNRGMVQKFYNPSITNLNIKGYNKVREFYEPKYDNPKVNTQQPDLRTTVYWSPYLKTNAEGKTKFSFYNADGPGSYKVVIEGINADGQLGRQTYRYTVNETQANTLNH